MLVLWRSHGLCLVALLLGNAVPTFSGCGGHDSGGTPDATPQASGPDPSAFIEGFTNLYCDRIEPCCKAAGYGHEAEACRADLDLSAIPAAIQLGVPYSEEAAAQCLQDLATWFDTCPMTWPLSCKRLLVGSEPPGGGCFTAYQCAPPDRGQTMCIGGQCNTVRYLSLLPRSCRFRAV
jgi:hypothetical protein